MKTIYQAAIRLPLGAFRFSPIKNMLAEIGLLGLDKTYVQLMGRAIFKVMTPDNSDLRITVTKQLSR